MPVRIRFPCDPANDERVRHLNARRRQALELMDAAAWLAGRYAAIAINAPGKYPSAPDGVNADLPDSEMTDAEIRGAFERLARKGGSE